MERSQILKTRNPTKRVHLLTEPSEILVEEDHPQLGLRVWNLVLDRDAVRQLHEWTGELLESSDTALVLAQYRYEKESENVATA